MDEAPGACTLRVDGKAARSTFANEAGGHRFQRVPPTERRGRVHTSTVTVAVLREPTEQEVHIDDRDLRWTACRGSGAGGQHRNTTDSAVQATHIPTGITVRCEAERSQHQNRATALSILRARILDQAAQSAIAAVNHARKTMIGSGMRADKRRTIRYQDGIVTDHVLDVRVQLRDYLRGDFGNILKGYGRA